MKRTTISILAKAVCGWNLLTVIACLFFTVGWSTTAQAQSLAPVFIVYDVGPTNKCWDLTQEYDPITTPYPSNPLEDASGCPADAETTRDDTSCSDFSYGHCPAWFLHTLGYDFNSDHGNTPGYNFQVTGSSPLTVTMTNQSYGTKVGSPTTSNSCTLHETAFGYDYPSDAIRRKPDWSTYTLSDGDLVVSYDAKIDLVTNHNNGQNDGGFSCTLYHRAILTTDLIYHYEDSAGVTRKNVISVVHFDPGHFAVANSDGVYWNQCEPDINPEAGTAPGCRVTIAAAQMVAPGANTPITVDFTQLEEKYAAGYLGLPANSIPANAQIDAIQIVSSNEGSDTTTQLSNTSAYILASAVGHVGPVRTGVTGGCLDDFGGSGSNDTKADVNTCNNGVTQNWTVGADNTLQINGACLDVSQANTADGTPVQLYACNGGTNQQWTQLPNGELVSLQSGKCLDDPAFSAVNGTQLDIWTCNNGANQHWILP